MAGRTSGPGGEPEPTPEPDDVDVRFAEIAASLGDLTVPPAEPAQARLDEEAEGAGPPPVVPGPRDFELAPETDLDDDEGPGFVPDEPAAVSAGDPVLVLGWSGLVGSVLVVLAYLLLWRGMPGAFLGIAGVVFVLAVGLLVWRLPGRRDPEDHDDGAVV